LTQFIDLKKIQTRILEPGIIEILFKKDVTIEPADIYELRKVNLQLSNEKPYGVLVSAEQLTSFSKETRELLASKEFMGLTIAKALVFDGLGQKLIGNFYLQVNRPHIKTRLFNDKKEALDWLRNELRNL
jgi:hypothetical protein